MKPARFHYERPASVEECVGLLERHGEGARVLAGGQSLVPLMNLRLATPEVVVDVNRIPGLAYIREDGGALAVGALTRHRELAASEVVRRRCPLLATAASLIGYPPIRVRGTVGGSLAHADPAAELPLVAAALDAELEVAGPRGRRTIPAAGFFLGALTTAMAPDELLVEARFPVDTPGDASSLQELARKSGDFALAAVAVRASISDGALAGVRVAVAGAGDMPARVPRARAALEGMPVDRAAAEAGALVAAEAGGDGALIETLARRAVAAVAGREG